ncbi:TolC family outer membrane protein [Thiomicrospira sp. XS5]|uniref:TolC family outer membrane protein n=1 Tax=Thiomicrospira sp. XS5 TaxID=1775636 RepID=UPI001F1E98B8|nr:TolC family outer membrane protein [Thiomicrospira sp. XS5]
MKRTSEPHARKMRKNVLLKPLAAAFLMASTTAWSAPGLVDIYQMAVLHDAKLAQARATYQANQEVVSIARAPLLPQLTADGSYVKNDSNKDAYDVTTQELGLNVTQSLYQHDNWAKYSQAKYQLQQSEYQMKFAEQDIIVRVADAYFKVVLAQEDVTLAEAKEAADKTQWERAKASAEVGLASKTDVLQAKSSYDLSKSDRITAQNNLDVAYDELMKLTGKEVHELKVISLNTKLPSQTLNLNDWEMRAQENNLTVLQQEEAANVASEEIEVQKSGYWFNVNLQAGYNDMSYSDTASGYDAQYTDRNNLSIGVYASMPLYSGGGTMSQVAQARSNYKAATAGLRDARETASLDARIQVRNVQRGQELVTANRAAVQSNDAFLEAAEEGYKVGLRNLLEVLTARTNMFQARRNLAESLHNVVLSRLKLEAAAGSLTSDKLEKYDQVLSNPTDEKMPKLDPLDP